MRIYVNSVLIKTITGIGASTTVSFTDTENENIFKQLAQTSSKASKFELDTYNGSTKIGSTQTYTGTCFAEKPSNVVSSADFNIGATVHVDIARNNPRFTHVVKVYVNNTLIETSASGIGYAYDWIPTSTDNTNMYNQTKTSNTVSSKIELVTYFGATQVNSTTNITGTATVINSNPTFSASNISYKDVDTTTTALTGNNQYIIQNKSSLTVTIGTGATGVNSATIASYLVTVNGVSKSVTATGDVAFGVINASSNLTISVKAIDSRGNSTTVTKTATVLAYSAPTITIVANRANGFDDPTTIMVSGNLSPLTISGTNKNSITAITSQYKENITSSTYSTAVAHTPTTTTSSYTATTQVYTLTNTKIWVVQVNVTDKLGTVSTTKIVGAGSPIMFVDAVKKSVGVGMFPVASNAVETAGDIYAYGGIHAKNPANSGAEVHLSWLNNIARIRYGGSGTGSVNGFQIHGTSDTIKLDCRNDGTVWGKRFETDPNLYIGSGGGIDLNNSDIIGVNSFWFNDQLDAGSEGINFLKTGKTAGSTSSSDYDTFQILDGVIKLNGSSILDFAVPPTAPSMQNSWANYFSLAYMKTWDNVVHFRGMIRNGAVGTTAFTLPAGCRPTVNNQVFYMTQANGYQVRVDINTDGTVTVTSVTGGGTFDNSWISFNGISFPTI
ncbi:DUF859 family phage minor structural protein [Priestia megaterium]|uniref:DUF859 family phage minor structural protein n=1 Tax=Priestia megaterium TaxID=1404 RepID=UPI002FFE4948